MHARAGHYWLHGFYLFASARPLSGAAKKTAPGGAVKERRLNSQKTLQAGTSLSGTVRG